jgi:hypothetical protein
VRGALEGEEMERGVVEGGLFERSLLEDLVRSWNRMRPAPREKGGMADVRREASLVVQRRKDSEYLI